MLKNWILKEFPKFSKGEDWDLRIEERKLTLAQRDTLFCETNINALVSIFLSLFTCLNAVLPNMITDYGNRVQSRIESNKIIEQWRREKNNF